MYNFKYITKKLHAAIILFVAIVSISQSVAASDVKTIQSDIKNLITAINKQDVDGSLKYIWRGTIEKMGGLQTAKRQFTLGYAQFKEAGIEFKDVKFTGSPSFFKSGTLQYAIVPIESVMHVRKTNQKIKTITFYLAVKENGAWTYVEGTQVNANTVKTLFPSFPKGIKFPKISIIRLN